MRRKSGMPRSLPPVQPDWTVEWQEVRPNYWHAYVYPSGAAGPVPVLFSGYDQALIRKQIKDYKDEYYRPKPITRERV